MSPPSACAALRLTPTAQVPESWLPPLDLPGQSATASGVLRSPSASPLHHRMGAAPSAHAGLRAVSREGVRESTALSTPTSVAPSVLGVSRGASTVDMAGLSEILDARSPGGTSDSRQVLGLKRTVSRARGIADSMEATPAFETPSRQASFAG